MEKANEVVNNTHLRPTHQDFKIEGDFAFGVRSDTGIREKIGRVARVKYKINDKGLVDYLERPDGEKAIMYFENVNMGW